jgi:PAS domain S-box-containing protein
VNRIGLRARVNIGLGAVVAIFLVISVRGLISIRQLVRTGNEVASTLEARTTVRSTMALLAEAEAAQRGYLLSNDTAFMTPYARTVDAIESNLDMLRRLTTGRSRQHTRYVRIAPLVRARLADLDALTGLHDAHRSAAVANLSRDRAVMDSLRTWLTGMDREELATLGPRQDASQDGAQHAMSLVVTGSLLAVLVALVLGRLLHRHLTLRLQAEALYRSVVDVMAEGVIVQYASGTVVDCNHASERILGMPRERIMTLNQTEWQGRREDHSPYPSAEHPALVTLRTGEPVNNEVMGIQRPDGAIRWLLMNSMPLRAGPGRPPVGVVTSFTDITRRREAEAAMNHSRAQMHDFLENATDLIVSTDAEGRIIYANRAWRETLGYTLDAEVNGHPLTDFMDAAGAAAALDALRQMRTGQSLRDLETTLVAKDGRSILVSGNCTPRMEGRRLVATQSIFRDVSELSVAQHQLMAAIEHADAANRAKSEFLANMSHELRTPLNSVIGFAGVLMRNKHGNLQPQDTQYLNRIHDNGRHLLGLINDILDLSKVESGRMELELTAFDLDTMLQTTLGQLEGMTQGRPVELRRIVPPGTRALVADESKLKQILNNLVSNALKFTETGSVTVRVATDRTGRPLAIDVTDTGIGIPLERQAAVFEAFQQADNSTSRRFGGTGLGLAITRSLCQLMGYEIGVTSQMGHGSTFTVRLVTEHAVAAGAEAPEPVEPERLAGEGRTVLVVDDDPDARTLLAQYVKDDGGQVIVAGSGEQGLRLARAHQPDLILLDIMMPQMNGLEVLERLREDPATSDIPVVVVSIVATEQRERAVGAVALIDKPARREEIEAVLLRYLDEPPTDKAERLNELLAAHIPVRV